MELQSIEWVGRMSLCTVETDMNGNNIPLKLQAVRFNLKGLLSSGVSCSRIY
jgi:hypothetical protein